LRLGAQKIYLLGCGSIGEVSPNMTGPNKAVEAARRRGSNGRRVVSEAVEAIEMERAPTVGANLLEILQRSWDVVSQYQFRRAVEELTASGAYVVSIEPKLPLLARAMDFNRSAVMIAAGRAAAEAALQRNAQEPSADTQKNPRGKSLLSKASLAS
jgi:hypothetical protein